jgi:hypothetical protein
MITFTHIDGNGTQTERDTATGAIVAPITDPSSWVARPRKSFTHPALPGWELIAVKGGKYLVHGPDNGITVLLGRATNWDHGVQYIAWLLGAPVAN